jgi:hypothetical protein
MVATHFPSSIFLALLPVPNRLPLTICFLVGRAVLNSMDQAPRSAFLSLVVRAEERTAVMGIVNILKTLSQSGGPWVTGVLAGRGHFWVAFVAAGSLKAAYDVLLLVFFAGKIHESGVEYEDAGDGDDGQVVDDLEVEDNARQGAVKSGDVTTVLAASEASSTVASSTVASS